MKGKNFTISAVPKIIDALCKCGNYTKQVSNGWFGFALFCPKCETVYELKMVKVPQKKVNNDFLIMCRNQTKER